MSDGAGAAAGAGASGGEAGAGVAGAGGGEGGAPATPEWLATLPEELRGDATLSRYKTVDDLARGHVEAHKVAKSKVMLPGADADDAAWAQFGQQLRPAEAKDYDIPVPEGDDGAFAEKFKAKAHEIGLPPRWAKALAEWQNGEMSESLQAIDQQRNSEVEAFKASTPDYQRKLSAAEGLLKELGWSEDDVSAIERQHGAAKTLDLFFKLGDRFGEAARVDGDGKPIGLGGGDTANAREQLKVLDASEEFRAKIAGNDPVAIAQRRRLLDAANQQAQRNKPA